MTVKIEIIDGETIEKNTIEEICYYMKKRDATLPNSLKEYMETVKKRLENINIEISTISSESFIKDLETIGFLKIIKD